MIASDGREAARLKTWSVREESVQSIMMSAQLTIIYEKSPDGWWIATIPEIPGAFSQGRTKAEARDNALDAMAELMAARRKMALQKKGPGVEHESVPLAANVP